MYYRKSGSSGLGPGESNKKALKSLVDRGYVPGLIGYEGGYLYGFNAGTGVMRLDDEQALTLTKLFYSGADKRVAT